MSPYRESAPRPPVVPARRGFLDTCRRLAWMGARRRWWRWVSFAGAPLVALALVHVVAPSAVLALGFLVGAAWAAFTALAIGFLRAKRCRWLMRRHTVEPASVPCKPMSVVDIMRAVNARQMTPQDGARRIAEMRE